jgi:hypothetical protein
MTSPETINSTLRFCCRPAAVVFEAIRCVFPMSTAKNGLVGEKLARLVINHQDVNLVPFKTHSKTSPESVEFLDMILARNCSKWDAG